MAELDLSSEISVLRETFASVRQVVDVSRLTAEIEKLKVEASDPNIWDDAARAQTVTSKLSRSQSQLSKLTEVEARLDDLEVLIEMANAESDAGVQAEAKQELAKLSTEIGELEVQTLLNGEYDSRAAVITIRAGAGGDDATDFA